MGGSLLAAASAGDCRNVKGPSPALRPGRLRGAFRFRELVPCFGPRPAAFNSLRSCSFSPRRRSISLSACSNCSRKPRFSASYSFSCLRRSSCLEPSIAPYRDTKPPKCPAFSANQLPDPDWKGREPRSIQELRFQSAMLANMCMWMVMPSKACFTVCFHALTRLDNGQLVDPPMILRADREGPLYCHPKDEHNPVAPNDLIKAAKLFETLSTVPRGNDVWPALRAFWAALASYWAD